MITLLYSGSAFSAINPNDSVFKKQLPPLGLMAISSFLKQNSITVDALYDLSLNEYTREEFLKIIRHSTSIFFGFSVNTENCNNSLRLAYLIKKMKPNAIIIFGGHHVTFLGKDILTQHDFVDFVIQGEGELPLTNLIQSITSNNLLDFSHIDGLVYRNQRSEVIINKRGNLPLDLNKLPFPDRQIINNTKYSDIAIQTSRGCPGKCSFCSAQGLYQGKVRFRSPENIVSELKYLRNEFDMKSFMFSDDTYTVNPMRLKKIIEKMNEEKLHFDYFCEARFDTLSNEIIELLSRSGCTRIQLGIETSSEISRSVLRKPIKPEDIQKKSSYISQNGITPITNFILGLPHESLDEMKKTLEYAEYLVNNFGYIVNFSICTPYPGTPYYDDPTGHGIRIIEKNFDYYNLEYPVFETKNFNQYQINELFLQSSSISNMSLKLFFKKVPA